MFERGVRKRFVQVYITSTSVRCLHESSGFHNPLGSKDLFTAYGIIFAGLVTAVSLLFAEKMMFTVFSRKASTENVEVTRFSVDLDTILFEKRHSLKKV
jgi:hypothetical protein